MGRYPSSASCSRVRQKLRPRSALGDHAGTASVWFSADVARWELEGRPDTSRLADGAALQEVSCELSGYRRMSCSQHFKHLADPQMQPPPTVRRELFVQRLLDQRMDERKPPAIGTATLLEQSRFESGV